MPDLTRIEQQTTPPSPQPASQRRIPRRIAQAIDLLMTGECTTQKAAAARVGIASEHLCRMLAKDHIRVFYERRARQTIAGALPRASRRLVELIDAGSEHVSLDATKHLLGVSGIAPAPTTSVNVNVDIKAGYVIDLATPPQHDVFPQSSQIEQTNNSEQTDQ